MDMLEAVIEFVLDITGDIFMDHGLEKIGDNQRFQKICKVLKRIFLTILFIAVLVGAICLIIYG